MEDKRSGSAQVVEFSWVFPFAAVVVILLLYLSFLLFFYVYSFHVAELTADMALHELQSSASAGVPKELQAETELKEQIHKISFLPGVRFSTEFQSGGLAKPIEVKIHCAYLGKPVFCVRAKREALNPVEYARKMDYLNFLKRM